MVKRKPGELLLPVIVIEKALRACLPTYKFTANVPLRTNLSETYEEDLPVKTTCKTTAKEPLRRIKTEPIIQLYTLMDYYFVVVFFVVNQHDYIPGSITFQEVFIAIALKFRNCKVLYEKQRKFYERIFIRKSGSFLLFVTPINGFYR